MANAYAAGQEEMLRELSNAIKMATTDEAIQLLYAFGEGAHENGFRSGIEHGRRWKPETRGEV